MNEVLNLSAEEFKSFVAQNELVLVDFWAPWCGPCRALAPVIDSLAKKYENKIKFVKINVDEAHSIAIEYRVESIPNVCLFKNSQLADRSIGFVPESALEQMINKHI
ncbi:MAG: thioredoxin [Clostridia bacterium]|nr:thioredoxin [Clostridia bacterium]